MSHFNEKTSEFSSFLESNEIIQNSNNTFSSRQKLSTSDIMPLDNEKDLYDALNNILETNIRDNISSNVQTINEKKPFLPTKLTVSEEISLASKWKDSNLRNEKLQNNNKENDSSNYEEEKNDKLFSYKNFVTIPEQRKKNKEFEEEDNFIHTGNFKKISHLNFKNNVLSEINSSNYIKAEEKLSPKIKKVLVEAKSFNNFRSNEKDEENNSLRFSERFDANIEKFSPLQNKSLMSNINEILCLINKDDNLNISNISSMNLQEEKSQFFENEAESKQNKFNGIFYLKLYNFKIFLLKNLQIISMIPSKTYKLKSTTLIYRAFQAKIHFIKLQNQ